MKIIRIPKRFYDDCVARKIPTPPIVKAYARHYDVDIVDPKTREDFTTRAEHCADGREFVPGNQGLIKSAQATLRALKAAAWGRNTEFPGYILDVEIPAGFEDASWHHDECPSWVSCEHKLTLWVHPAGAKVPARFLLSEIDDDGVDGGLAHALSNNFREITDYLEAHRAEGFPRLNEI